MRQQCGGVVDELQQTQFINNTAALLSALAQAREVNAHDIAGCNTLLDRVMLESQAYRGFSVNTLDGVSWCLTKSLRDALPPNASASPSPGTDALYARALERKGFVVGDVLIGNITGRPNLLFVHPVYDDTGAPLYMVSAGLNLDWLNGEMEKLPLSKGYTIDILDRDGTFVVRWPDAAGLIGKTVTDSVKIRTIQAEAQIEQTTVRELDGVDGVRRVFAFKRLASRDGQSDLFIAVGATPDVVYGAVDRAFAPTLALTVAFALASLIGVWLVAERTLLRPLRAIGSAARAIRSGNTGARVSAERMTGELGVLARDFNDMCADLERNTIELQLLNADLEKRVGVRTEQLNMVIARLRESREQMRELSRQQRHMLESEQTRISREVHDQIGQSLTALKMDVATMQARVKAADNMPDPMRVNLTGRLVTMSELIDDTIQTARSIARQLRPSLLDDLGLEAALEWSATDFQNRSGIATRFVNETAGPASAIDPRITTTAYRIVQEALTNVVRHAKASAALITFKQTGDGFVLSICDNGVGLPEGSEAEKSLGVLGMKERALEVGGDVMLRAGSGEYGGVCVDVHLPNTPHPPIAA